MAVLIEETGTQTLSELEQIPLEEMFPYEEKDDEGGHFTHIINPPMNEHIWKPGPSMDPQEIVNTARITGQEIVALCGYKWVPARNPEKYDVCPECMKIARDIIRRLGES